MIPILQYSGPLFILPQAGTRARISRLLVSEFEVQEIASPRHLALRKTIKLGGWYNTTIQLGSVVG